MKFSKNESVCIANKILLELEKRIKKRDACQPLSVLVAIRESTALLEMLERNTQTKKEQQKKKKQAKRKRKDTQTSSIASNEQCKPDEVDTSSPVLT